LALSIVIIPSLLEKADGFQSDIHPRQLMAEDIGAIPEKVKFQDGRNHRMEQLQNFPFPGLTLKNGRGPEKPNDSILVLIHTRRQRQLAQNDLQPLDKFGFSHNNLLSNLGLQYVFNHTKSTNQKNRPGGAVFLII
jgi:hypothetical protein